MGVKIVNLFVIMAVGVMIANMVAHPSGTKSFWEGINSMWRTGVNGMLGHSLSWKG